MPMQSEWTFLLATGVAVAALAWLAGVTLAGITNPVRRRLRALSARSRPADPVAGARAGTVAPLWHRLEPVREAERSAAALRLLRAGFQNANAVGALYGAKLACAALAPMLTLGGLWLGDARLPLLGWITAGLGACFIGSLLPDLYLTRLASGRRQRLMEGLPDALDLLVTCTEAGLGLGAALERVAEQMPGSHPDLAFELGQVNAEIRAGIDRSAALRNLGDRSGLEEISGLVSLISHSARLGTGIAGTLRIYADDFRDRRMQRAEELAATVGTKLIFPLLLCFFPSFFVVAIGPAILSVMQVLSER